MPQTMRAGKRLMTFIITAAVAAGWAAAQAQDPKVLGFTKQFVIEITNPSPLALENHAVVIDVAGIRASVAADFNTYNYALFEKNGDDYTLVVTQADDLDKDRYHDEIVLVRTLPPSSTTRLVCYYSPTRSFQLMPAPKAFARFAWATGGAEAGWESNLDRLQVRSRADRVLRQARGRADPEKIPVAGKQAPGLGHGRHRRRRFRRARRPHPLGRRHPRSAVRRRRPRRPS